MSNIDQQTAAKGTLPTHIAYQVRKGSQKNQWTRIGAAWTHKDGKGFNIQLECAPWDGRITLRIAPESN